MRKIYTFLFALSISTAPVASWGWGDSGDCPYSKDKASQENTEQVEESGK